MRLSREMFHKVDGNHWQLVFPTTYVDVSRTIELHLSLARFPINVRGCPPVNLVEGSLAHDIHQRGILVLGSLPKQVEIYETAAGQTEYFVCTAYGIKQFTLQEKAIAFPAAAEPTRILLADELANIEQTVAGV